MRQVVSPIHTIRNYTDAKEQQTNMDDEDTNYIFPLNNERSCNAKHDWKRWMDRIVAAYHFLDTGGLTPMCSLDSGQMYVDFFRAVEWSL